jgi:hypothetical protein
MAVTYEWSFPTLDVIHNEVDPATEEPVQNVVTTVHWVYTARDGDYTATMYSTVGLSGPGQPFTAYEDLTPDIVQGWVESALGADQVAEMQQSLVNSIEIQKKPQGGSMTPPWQA